MSARTFSSVALMMLAITIVASVFAWAATQYSRWAVTVLAIGGLVVLTVLLGNWLLRRIEDPGGRQAIQRAFYVGLVIRLVVALIFYLGLLGVAWKGRPGIFFDDESFYVNLPSLAAVTSWSEAWQSSVERAPHVLYLLYTNALFLIFGDTNLVVRLVSGVLAALIVPIVARIAFHLATENNGTRLAVVAAWITALSPELILFSVAVLREWMIALALTFAVLMVLELLSRWHRPGLIMCLALSIGALVLLRVATSLLLLTVIALWVILELLRKGGSPVSALRAVALPCLALFVLLVFAAQRDLLPFSPLSVEAWSFLISQRYLFDAEVQARIGEAFAQTGSFLESSALLLGSQQLGWLFAAAKRLVSPSPLWFPAVGAFNGTVYLLPGLFWYALMPTIAVGAVSLLQAIDTKRAFVLLVAAAFFLVTFSPLGLGLEPLRARVQVFPILYLVGAQGVVVLQSHRAVRRLVILTSVFLYFAVTLFYYLGLLLPWPVLHPYSLAIMVIIGAGALGIAWMSRVDVTRAWKL